MRAMYRPIPVRAWLTVSNACRYTSSYLIERPSRSMNTLSRQQPMPSIQMRMPWSVSKFSSAPNRQIVASIDHRFALSMPALDERSFQKIILQRQLADLGVKHFQVNRRS